MGKIGNKLMIGRSARHFGAALLALVLLVIATLIASGARFHSSTAAESARSYLGFDRNIYPGDAAMKILRKDFAFTGYWLSPPPGEKTNTWSGKRDFLRSLGYGFLPLVRARESRELHNLKQAQEMGRQEARATVEVAEREGFPHDTLIFLDIEEGGRLSPNYHAYIRGWLWELTPVYYRGGFYCSGIPVKEEKGKTITTCEDIEDDLFHRSRAFTLWAYNDMCPPSPGCAFPGNPPAPAVVGKTFCDSCIDVWQFAQSPRRKEFTAHCPVKYSGDGNCYAPSDTAHDWFLDVNTARSPDPSGGAR